MGVLAMVSNKEVSNKGRTSVWLCLHFHQLALDMVCRDEQGQAEPLVITEKQRVYQCNTMAMALGIKPGHSMDTAFSLSQQVSNTERNLDRETAALQHLAQWAYQFTPNVAIKEPNCLILEVTSSLALFSGLTKMKSRIWSGLREQGYCAAITVSSTPQAAMLLAIAGLSNEDALPKATSPKRRDISSVSVRHLQTTHKIVNGLQQMGIHHLSQLLELPISGLTRRFGTYFTDYLQRLTGDKPDPQTFISPAANFYHDVTFLHDVTNLESLTFPINRLLKELADFLSGRQFWMSHMTWHLSHRNHARQSFSVHLAAPANDRKMFLTLTQLKLDQIDSVKELDNIALSVKRFFPAGQTSGDLFRAYGTQQKGRQSEPGDQQNQLLNMLTARLGPGKCFGLSEANDHRPEKAWKKIRLHEKDYWVSPEQDDLPRPSFLLPTPKALNVVDNTPCLAGKLALVKGPERIDFGWWDQQIDKPLARDYYVARQRDGGMLWVFKHLDAGRWYLHGIFS
ncbi:MAG: protein ImuB [Candidatus Azotimanducaceae bacterium]|jgi:protein ImuB